MFQDTSMLCYQYFIQFYGWKVVNCMDMPHFVYFFHQLMDIWVFSTFLTIMEKMLCYGHSCTNFGVDICFQFSVIYLVNLLGHMVPNFLRNSRIIFLSGYAILLSIQQCMWSNFSTTLPTCVTICLDYSLIRTW